MRAFRFESASDLDGALAVLSSGPDAKFLGGGTNLVDLMRLGVETPDVLVDVTRVLPARVEPGPDGGLRIGGGMRNSDLAADPSVRAQLPVLSLALLAGASGQLRNAATVAGNLLQRTRCLYFQDVTKPCNKRVPGSGCPAREGISRDLGILGTSEHCVATHPSDMAVALAALDAVVHLHTADGPREMALGDFFRVPGHEPQRDTNLPPGALITAVSVPGLPFASRSTYRKVRDRAAFAFAIVSVAAAVDVEGGVVRDVRVALGGVAHMPWRAHALEDALRGQPATEEAFGRAADAELAAARPLPDNAFKVPLARNLVVRTLADLVGGAA